MPLILRVVNPKNLKNLLCGYKNEAKVSNLDCFAIARNDAKCHGESKPVILKLKAEESLVERDPSLTLRMTDNFVAAVHFVRMTKKRQKAAFTLAEVLITLGIIGIVAAMTLPTLIGNYKKEQTISQLQKAYSTLNQAFRLSEAENESSIYWDTEKGIDFYFNEYWKPYLKIITYCKGSRVSKACAYDSGTPWKRANGRNDSYLILDDANRMPVMVAERV